MKSNYDILGNHIRLIDTRNRESITDRVLGINIDKFFMPSVANVIGTDLSKYKLITKGKFACNPMHVGRDERLPVALYDEEEPAIVSPAYFMFEVIDNSILNEDYLMMWFRRPEFDRICWLHTDGSVRGGITWDDICRLELPIPPIENQLEIVNIYKAITERIALKQKINDNLAATIQTIFLSCKQSDTFKTYLPLNELVKTVNFRNKDNVYGIDDLMGVSLTKEFIKSPANTISLDVSNYKIVKPFQFACNLMHVGRDKKVAVGMLTDADNVIISPAFTVFETINNNVILPEVLVSWFSQSFFDNEVSYLASEGIRDGIKWDTFAQIPIFIPEFEIQTKIQNIYKNIQQNKLEISTLNNFADTFITTLSSC
ncbi:restriction endonuclease subunit S [Hominilimicola sp.]|jgi:restriction endonuclease S subunit